MCLNSIPHEQISQDRLWSKRPDGLVFKMKRKEGVSHEQIVPHEMPTKTKAGVICFMEFKNMSDVTDRYVVRVKREVEEQYESFRSDQC